MVNVIGVLQITVLCWLIFGLPVIMRHYYHLGHSWLVWGLIIPAGCIVINVMLINFFAQILIFFEENEYSEKEICMNRQKLLDNSFRVQKTLMLLAWVMWLGTYFFS